MKDLEKMTKEVERQKIDYEVARSKLEDMQNLLKEKHGVEGLEAAVELYDKVEAAIAEGSKKYEALFEEVDERIRKFQEDIEALHRGEGV